METELHKGVMITPKLSDKAFEILKKNGYDVQAIDPEKISDFIIDKVRMLKAMGCL